MALMGPRIESEPLVNHLCCLDPRFSRPEPS